MDADDPYDCGAPLTQASMYRRPLPTTNLAFLSTVMWDGRETVKGQAIRSDLLTQASDATTGHAQGAAPSPVQLQQIVDFELGLFTAQTHDNGAGSLEPMRAGGPGRAVDRTVLHRHQRSVGHAPGHARRLRDLVGTASIRSSSPLQGLANTPRRRSGGRSRAGKSCSTRASS